MSTHDSISKRQLLNNNNKNNLNNNLINTKSPFLNSVEQNRKNKCLNKACIDYAVQMEHSYSRDCRPVEGINGLTTRTLMVHKPPQCPSCHAHPLDEGLDSDEASHPPIPPYNESAAKDAMDETTKVSQNVRNSNLDDEEWEERVPKLGWTTAQEKLFSKITRILDLDNLSRLATVGRQHEPVHRRVIIDRSVHRFRQVFASISWDSRLTQWLNGILMEYLPSNYMAIYLDILQTLKTKLPNLMDKMLFSKPMNINQELLTPVMKKQWDPVIPQKQRKLPTNTIIIIVPSTSYIANGMSSRMQKWCQLFSTMGQVVQVQIPNAAALSKQPIDQICEHLVHLSRVKVQDLRRENPNSHIVLVGFNAGAALALQVSLTENVNSIICLGFAYNTLNGVRGTPDDHILGITTPIMFIIGQNSARTSQEEMESLRERMQSASSLVVVGSADDVLRVPKSKRQIEGVTQSMVDSMVIDEIFEFIKNCILNPPGPRQVNTITTLPVQIALSQARKVSGAAGGNQIYSGSSATTTGQHGRKRKISNQNVTSDLEQQLPTKMKYVKNTTLIGRPRTRPLANTIINNNNNPQSKSSIIPHHAISKASNEILDMAIQSILPENNDNNFSINNNNNNQELGNINIADNEAESQILSALELLTQSPKKEIKLSPTTVTPLSSNTSGIITNLQQQPQTRTTQFITAPSSSTTQKIKMIPTNQFIQVKPPSQSNAQRIYTIKTSPMLAAANNQSQVFTVKTAGTQLTSNVGSASSANTIILNSPPKFTVYKTGAANLSNNLQTTDLAGGNKSSTIISNATAADLSTTNILDLPILFADNDGNFHETAPINTSQTTIGSSSSTPNTIILNPSPSLAVTSTPPQQTTGLLSQSSSGKLILNTTSNSVIQRPKANKVVYINRNSIKPMNANLLTSKSIPPLKYTKVVVTNPKTAAPSLVPKASGQQRLDANKGVTTITLQKPLMTATGGAVSTGGIIKTSPATATIIGNSSGGNQVGGQTTSFVTTGTNKFQPIIINVDGDKTFKNVMKIGSSGSTSVTGSNDSSSSQVKQTILFKPGSLKTLPVTGFKPGILNRNLTVRKVNIIKPGTTLSQISGSSGTVVIGSPKVTNLTTAGGGKGNTTAATTVASLSLSSGGNSSNTKDSQTLKETTIESGDSYSGSGSGTEQNIFQIQQNDNQ